MSNNTIPSIEALPLEVFHRIFDNLDTETILLSIRQVCRFFRSVVHSYNRYILNFTLMSKPNFVILCRLINPENVISLTLADDRQTPYQPGLFLSLVDLPKLTRLRSLTLLNINEIELCIILKYINCDSLTSVSFYIEDEDDNPRLETTKDLFSSLIKKPNLRSLEFSLSDDCVSKISWPISCTIQYLKINSHIDMNNLCRIFHCCPHLHTLFVRLNYPQRWDNIIPTSFKQLRSLTIEDYNTTIELLEHLLLFIPSLVYLKLIHGNKMLDGNRWEQFIQVHLPHLNKFEFFFEELVGAKRTPGDVELIIDSFRTPFWLEHKKWFVICEYRMDGKYIYLYTIPICKSELLYQSECKKILSLNSFMTVQEDSTMNNNVKSLILLLNQSLADEITEKVCFIIPNLNICVFYLY
jgi:hypothetical protein